MTEVATFVALAAAMVFGSVYWLIRPVAGRDGRAVADRKTALALLVIVPLAVVLVYARLGRLDVVAPLPPDPVRTMGEERTAALETRLAKTPGDVSGLRLLARSYEQLGRFNAAATVRSRLVALRPDDPDALVDEAETLAMAQGGSYAGEPIEIARRALALDEGNHRALASIANEAVEREDFAAAIVAWKRILDEVPFDSEVAQSLRINVARARESLATNARP